MDTILYVMCSQHYSGAEIVMERLMIANRRHVRPLVLCPPGPYADRLRAQGVQVLEEPALLALDRVRRRHTRVGLLMSVLVKYARITWRLIMTVRRDRPSLVHATNLSAAAYLLPALLWTRAFSSRTRWVWSNFDLAYPFARSSHTLARLCHKYYERTIAASNAVRDRYRQYEGRIDVIHAGLDPTQLQFDAEARRGFRQRWSIDTDGTIAIGIVGMIEEGKGHHLLVEAVGALLPRWPAVRLFIIGSFGAGDPGYEERLYTAVERSAAGRVIFTGRTDAIKEAFCGLDILVNATTSTRGEPLGTTIYEAMACERIVLATRTGGSPEIIDDGIDGFLCAPDSATALAARLEHVLSHYGDMDRVRGAARDKVARHFTVDRMCDEYNHVLRRMGVRPERAEQLGSSAVLGR